MVTIRQTHPETHPLLGNLHNRHYDTIFAAPSETGRSVCTKVDALNRVHYGWQARHLFTIGTRIEGLPAPASIINTPRERKSTHAVGNLVRRWVKGSVTGGQAKSRSQLRLNRDAVLAAIRYYGLDSHAFDLPTDADILMWSPGKVRSLTKAAQKRLSAHILRQELPESEGMAPDMLPRVALHVGVVAAASLQHSSEECYLAFTAPKPFWRTEGETLFCVPLMIAAGTRAILFAGTPHLAPTFAQRGRVRFERIGAGEFVQR